MGLAAAISHAYTYSVLVNVVFKKVISLSKGKVEKCFKNEKLAYDVIHLKGFDCSHYQAIAQIGISFGAKASKYCYKFIPVLDQRAIIYRF